MSGDSYSNLLLPPIGTSYDELQVAQYQYYTPKLTPIFRYCRETITIFENQELSYNNGPNVYRTEKVTWSVDLYKYVTGAKPTDPNFRQNGGAIYIVMVHHGVASNHMLAGPIKYGHRITVPSTLNTVRHYPATDSGTQDGENWDYAISFKQGMPMFQNGGNSTFNFDAEYQETFTRSLAKQDGGITSTGAEFSLEYQRTPASGITWPIHGLTLFKTQDTTIFPLTINFEVYAYERLGKRPGFEQYIGRANTNKSINFVPSP